VNAGLLSSYALLSALIPSIGKQSSIIEYNKNVNSLSSIAKNCTKFVGNDYIPIYSCHMATETGLLGICSFVLTMTNIICIIGKEKFYTNELQRICLLVVAMIILRIKEVVPIMSNDEIGNQIFFFRKIQFVF
jgi:hypothetical protein